MCTNHTIRLFVQIRAQIRKIGCVQHILTLKLDKLNLTARLRGHAPETWRPCVGCSRCSAGHVRGGACEASCSFMLHKYFCSWQGTRRRDKTPLEEELGDIKNRRATSTGTTSYPRIGSGLQLTGSSATLDLSGGGEGAMALEGTGRR
jgi:hypothetical protein